jgi:hypothetical protein
VIVDYAFVAEAADSQAGLFYVTRGGTDIFALPRDFPRPLRLGAISFVVRVLGEPHEVGQDFTLLYTVVDADGRIVGYRQEIPTTFQPHPIDATRTTASIVALRFYGFPIPEFGAYLFEVHHGDERLAQVPFWVVPVDVDAGEAGGWPPTVDPSEQS